MAMMDQMIKDVEMETMHDEADAQEENEEAMKDSADKREEDSKLVVKTEGSKADTMTRLWVAHDRRATKRDQFGITQDKEQSIYVDCDDLFQTCEVMKTKRATESDGIKDSKVR